MRVARRDPFEPTPICRCRVLYLGSSVPQVTKDGLQGIQDPLRELYPSEGAVSARGIDSWLSVWSNGLLLENVDENQKKVTRFFPIESLHYCAAVRYVIVSGGEGTPVPRFLPLDSPFARNPNINHPPLFACIMRRTTGIKVLECHAFICKRETPANALVRCCFHAYADSMYAKSIEVGSSQYGSVYGGRATQELAIEVDYTGDLSSVNSEIVPGGSGDSSPNHEVPTTSAVVRSEDEISIYNGDENHKVWAGPSKTETDMIYSDYSTGTIRSAHSASSLYGTSASSRANKPRQMIMPSVAPALPPSEADKENISSRKGKKELNKSRGKQEDDMNKITNNGPAGPQRHPPGFTNGRRMPLNGSLPRHMNGSLPRPMAINGAYIDAPMIARSSNGYGTTGKPKGKIPKMFSSLSERKTKSKRPPPPFMMVPGPHPGPPTHMMNQPPPHPHMGPPHMGPPPHMLPPHMQGGPPGPPPPMVMGPYGPMPPPSHLRRATSRAAEEPIYMPSSRPMSPTASYQPGHFPHEQYLMQQYATSTRSPTKVKKKKKNKRYSAQTDEDIYGRKANINERAFSASIREEHRSRSFSSLVDVDGPPPTNKKDREIMQMVADLDLSGDEIERVEPKPGVYRPPKNEQTGTVGSRGSRR